MKNEGKFIGLKDLVLDVLLSVLVLVISIVLAPLFSPLGILVSSILALVIPAIVGGIVYVLMITKAPRVGTYFIFSFIFGVFFLVSGTLSTALFFVVAGLLGEISMIGGREKKWRALAPYLIHWLFYAYSFTVQCLLMRDVVLKTYMGMGMDEAAARATIDSVAAVYTAPQNIIIVGVCALASGVIGYFAGTRALRRHFRAAGVA